MTWNANIPATNAALLSAPLRDNFQALDTSFYAPLTAATDGYLLYRAAGPTVSGEANLLWDATNNNLKLFGGGVGTSGNGILALGPSSTAPTTSPVDTVQFYTADMDGGAGNRSLFLRDERGAIVQIGSISAGSRLTMTEPTGVASMFFSITPGSGNIGTSTNHLVEFYTNNISRMKLTTAGNVEFFGGTIGTSGAGVLALGPGTAPTTSPVDTVQLYTVDVEAGSRAFKLRDERGGTLAVGSQANGDTNIWVSNVGETVGMKIQVNAGGTGITTTTSQAMNLGVNNFSKYLAVLSTGDVSIWATGLGGYRQLTIDAPDTAGTGYRRVRVTN
jgi:hypothetical protein